MKIKETIGIDVSKCTFDVFIYSTKKRATFANTQKGFKAMLVWVRQNSSFGDEEILYGLEHTGLYSYQLSIFLQEQGCLFVMLPGLEVKRSLGISRGKDDQIDASKIALYCYRVREELIPVELPSEALRRMKHLLGLRSNLVKERAGHQSRLGEQKRVLEKKKNQVLLDVQQKVIACLNKQIEKIEQEMLRIINSSEELKKNYDLLLSIKGVGRQTATCMLVETDNFKKFKGSRQFASYSGIAPFPNSSGSSLKGKARVSHLANKKMKYLLNMCAICAIQHNPEMKSYYQRRVAEGKNKMSTINIIRNKMAARMFAVVQRGTPYVDVMKYAA